MGCGASAKPATGAAAAGAAAPDVPTYLMFHIGTNNWQVDGVEAAPGSGILHESMHKTFNSMPGVRCYSIYPSQKQKNPTGDNSYQIFQIEHPIPICESCSPNSSFRWHSMSDEEFASYKKRLEDEICAFMDEVETAEGKQFDFLVSHHAFTNAMAGAEIVQKRRLAGNNNLKHFNFVHGTALKMYMKEMEGDAEYPSKFLPMAQNHIVFKKDREYCSGIWVNSEDYIGKFLECFPGYPRPYCVFSRIGVNQTTFCPKGTTIMDLEKYLKEDDKPKLKDIKKMVAFVGKFADWKRLDAVLYAAKEYEAAFPDLGTVVIGGGPEDAVQFYEGLATQLALQRVFFLGAQPQSVLAEAFSASELGMFPSYKEPFGMVFIECMACGTPVLGVKSGGPVEFVKDEQGVLIDEEPEWNTPEGAANLGKRLAEVVTTALNEDWKGKTKGPTCPGFVSANYSPMVQCQGMLDNMILWSKSPAEACIEVCDYLAKAVEEGNVDKARAKNALLAIKGFMSTLQ